MNMLKNALLGTSAIMPAILREDDGGGGGGGADTAPDWLNAKYHVMTAPDDGGDPTLDIQASVAKQAEGYNALYANYSKKTDTLRGEVKAEAIAEYGKTIGVPDDAKGYQYPEGFKAPVETADTALRDWAKANNVAPNAFQSLIKDVYGPLLPNAEAEIKKLGGEDKANSRADAVNGWVSKAVDPQYAGVVEKIMQTAEGVEFFESMMAKTQEGGFAPGDEIPDTGGLTREEIRKLQADPRFGEDDAYTKMVRGKWAAYAALPVDKRK